MARAPEICPHCGAEVPANARACPECGSDEETGWSDKAREQELGVPDDDFNYEEFVKEEFGKEGEVRPRGIARFWWVVAVILLFCLLYWLIGLR
jgi:hypothetical protein